MRVAKAVMLVAAGAIAARAEAQSASESAAYPRRANAAKDTTSRIEIYGFTQADVIYDFRRNNPAWFDVNRPSQLPAFEDEFGADRHVWFSVRQSRFGVKAAIPTRSRDIEVVIEWDLFGVGEDAGQTSIHPLNVYGQWGGFGAGQTDSPFMDLDVFPNILDYWGPSGMLYFRNVMVFWQPINRENGTRATFAIERPGATGDGGIFADRIEMQDIRGRFPVPDVSGEYRHGGKSGYLEVAGMIRWMRWDDVLPDTFDLSGGATGWGVALSSNLNAGRNDVLRLMGVYGAGVESYFNDAPVDVGAARNIGSSAKPISGVALPNTGIAAFLDHRWNAELTTAFGYSLVHITNSDAQAPTAFQKGQYALINLLWTPTPQVMLGGELQWVSRRNVNTFESDDVRLEFSMRHTFSSQSPSLYR